MTLGNGQIIVGDCREVLRGMEARSVHCIVGSPPYYQLRDYGTAQWEGGDADCDHRQASIRTRRNLAEAANACDGGSRKAEDRADHEALHLPYRGTCGKCGAVRTDKGLGNEAQHDCLAWARGEDPCAVCYICALRTVARELWRVLRDDGTFWLNLGDSMASTGGNHAGRSDNQPGVGAKTCHEAGGGDTGNRKPAPGLKPTDLCGIPQRVALALQSDGWYWRSDVIWAKPNPQPESVTSRPAKSHEHILMLTKRAGWGAYFDMEAVKERGASGTSDLNKMVEQREREGGKAKELEDPLVAASSATNIGHKRGVGDPGRRHLRDVWTIPTRGFGGSHFAVFPVDIPDRCIRASTSEVGCCPVMLRKLKLRDGLTEEQAARVQAWMDKRGREEHV
jgi:hypothetical protein